MESGHGIQRVAGRDALIWLGEADPCNTMEELRGADPKLEALTSVLAGWREVIGMDRVSVRDVIERATDQRPQLYGRTEFIHPEFREALLRVADPSCRADLRIHPETLVSGIN